MFLFTRSSTRFKCQWPVFTVTLRTVVTDADLLALCEHLLVRENGEPWAGDAAKLRSTQLQKPRAYLQTEELEPTYEHVLCAASIQQYCDDGETTANDGSIASMADTAIHSGIVE